MSAADSKITGDSDTVIVDDRRLDRSRPIPPWLPRAGLIATDTVVLIAAMFLATWLRFGDPLGLEHHILIVMLVLPAMVLLAELRGLYRPEATQMRVRTTLRWVALWSLVIGFALAALFFSKTGDLFSRLWLGLWYASVLVLALPARLVWAGAIRSWRADGRLGERVAVAGRGALLDSLVATLDQRMPLHAAFHDRRADPATPLPAAVHDRLGRLDRLVLNFEPTDEARIESWLRVCRNLHVDVDLAPPFVNALQAYEPHDVGGLVVWRMATRPMSDEALALKRAEDLVLGSLSLVVALPIMALVMLAIRLDSPGPVLFRQWRHGFNGQTFEVLKFRSMQATPRDEALVPQARRHDPRITRVGAFIRRTSLDELPQLFNVLRGEMSLVGPRPHAVAHNDAFGQEIENYFRRHRIKPGITGWAQVNGYRGETDTLEKMEKRVELDLYYIDNWALAFDLRILLRTITVIIHPNAY